MKTSEYVDTLLQEIGALPLTFRPAPLISLAQSVPWFKPGINRQRIFDALYGAVHELRLADRLAPMVHLLKAISPSKRQRADDADPEQASYERRHTFLSQVRNVVLDDIAALPAAHQYTLLSAFAEDIGLDVRQEVESILLALKAVRVPDSDNQAETRAAHAAHARALNTLAMTVRDLPFGVLQPDDQPEQLFLDVFHDITTLPAAYQGRLLTTLLHSTPDFSLLAFYPSFFDHVLSATVVLPPDCQSEPLAALLTTVTRNLPWLQRTMDAVARLAEGPQQHILVQRIRRLDPTHHMDLADTHHAVLAAIDVLLPQHRHDVFANWAHRVNRLSDAELSATYGAYMTRILDIPGPKYNKVLLTLASLKPYVTAELNVIAHFEILAASMHAGNAPDSPVLFRIAESMAPVLAHDRFQAGIDQFFATLERLETTSLLRKCILDAVVAHLASLSDMTRVEALLSGLLTGIDRLEGAERNQILRALSVWASSTTLLPSPERVRHLIDNAFYRKSTAPAIA